MCVSIVSTNFVYETFLILGRTDQDTIKHVYWSSCNVPIIFVRFLCNFNFLDRYSKKYSNTKFHENPSSGSRVIPCG